jgi:hypothetical protein
MFVYVKIYSVISVLLWCVFMEISNAISNFENAVKFIQGCSVSIRTKEGDIPLVTSPSKSNNSQATKVYSGDAGKGLAVAVVSSLFFSRNDLLSVVGLVSLTFAATTFQILYHPPKTVDVVKESFRKLFWW